MPACATMKPAETAAFLRAHESELIGRWTTRVKSDPDIPGASGLPEPALHDHVPRLIRDIIEVLDACEFHETAERAGRSLRGDEASADHAAHRFASKYALSAALRELSHLRVSMYDLFEAHDVLPNLESTRALATALDESMTTIAVEMERAAKAALQAEVDRRERFAAILAHDLRQPLHSMLFSTALLGSMNGLAEEARHAIETGRRAAHRMAAMIDDVLDVARALHGSGLPLALTEVDLKDILLDAAEETRAAMPGARFAIRVDGNVRGRWDPERLAQLASNLFGNAVKHGATTSEIDVVAREDGEMISISIENQNRAGPIPKELLPTLFQPFERGPSSARGLGLGLYIAAQIAKAHGGTIDVRSTENTTRFTVWLPRAPGANHRPPEE